MDDRITVSPALDGGNPRSATDICARDGGVYIFPFSEDGDPNYKFHMNVQLTNRADEPIPVKFIVDWGDEGYQKDRAHLLICSDDDTWSYVDVEIDGTKICGTGMVPPGTSYLTFHPRYEHGRLDRLVQTLPKEILTFRTIGKSRKQRGIYALESGSANRKPLVFYGRVHPYETIASYFIEGMIKWLAAGSDEARKLLGENRIAFVPMPNPDGVAEGTHKLTLGGLNFSGNFRPSVEPEAVALKNYFMGIQPSVIFDIHGWNNRRDNLVTNGGAYGRNVYRALLAEGKLFYKPVDLVHSYHSWDHSCTYFADKLGLVFFNSSWNHVGRTSAELYAMGVALLKATAAADHAPNARDYYMPLLRH